MIEEELKKMILEKYGSLRSFAIKIDMPHTTIDSILKRGIENSNVSNVIRICKALDISSDILIDEKRIMPNILVDNGTWYDIESNVIKIPILGRIPAGMPFEAIEEKYAIDYEEIPKSWLKGGKQFFALKLDGDSMEPDYHDKDIVIFLKTNDCESGQDCCVKINGFDATFKRVKKQENGIMIIPLNENNSSGFTTTFYTNEDIINKPIEIIGVVKQIRRNM